MVLPRIFFDVEGPAATAPGTREKYGRIVFELFADEVPQTAENVRALATGEKGLSKLSGAPLHYKNSKFHRAIKGFMIQGGELKGAAKGGESIYGGPLEDENFNRKHSEAFLMSMANRGPNTATSQFFITTRPTPHLDGKHVVVGRVVFGEDVVSRIEGLQTDAKDRPMDDVIIVHCGELELRTAPREERVAEEKQTSTKRSRGRQSDSESNSARSRSESSERSRSRSRSQSSSRSRSRSRSRSTKKREEKRRRKEEKRRKKEKKRLKKEERKQREAAADGGPDRRNGHDEAKLASNAPGSPIYDVPRRQFVDHKGRAVKGRGFNRFRDYEDDRMGGNRYRP